MNNKYNLSSQWEKCPFISKLIADNFIAIKTPLDERYKDLISDDNTWNLSNVFDALKDYKIGLWINLTNSSDFYNKDIIEEKNIKYVEVPCKAHGDYPSRKQTLNFINLCHNFLMKQTTKKIVVHCNYGYNITGFLICAYILEKQGWIIEDALSEFAKHRPPGIYNKTVFLELYERYGDSYLYYGYEEKPVVHQLPLWCSEQEFTDDDLISFKEIADQCNSNKHKEIFMEDVKGIFKPKPYDVFWLSVKRKCEQLCGWRNLNLLGRQRDSLNLINMQVLKNAQYHVSYQDDGKRCMMLIDGQDRIFLIDRNNTVFQCKDVRFPQSRNLDQHLCDTLLDGEMVVNEDEGQKSATYFIHDIIIFQNQEVGKLNFSERLGYIIKEIIKPRKEAKKNGKWHESSEPFDVKLKDFWPIKATSQILQFQFSQQNSYGLIFQPEDKPYKSGLCPYSLKWRLEPSIIICLKGQSYNDETSKLVSSSEIQMFSTRYSSMKTNELYTHDLYDKLNECIWDYGNKVWVVIRIRSDKSTSDSMEIINSVKTRISRTVEKEVLLDYISKKPADPLVQHYNHSFEEEFDKIPTKMIELEANKVDRKEIEKLSKKSPNLEPFRFEDDFVSRFVWDAVYGP